MSPNQLIIFALAILGFIILGITVIIIKRNKKISNQEETNYLTFFILGITFLPMGIVMSITIENPGFFGIAGMGAVFLIIGLANRKKWEKGGKR